MAKQNLNTLQVARGVAAVAVLLHHVERTMYKPEYFAHPVLPWLYQGSSGVYLFFVLSGFVMVLNHWGDIGVPGKALPFFKKRIVRIYPPLIIVLLCIAPIYFVFFKDRFDLASLPSALLILPEPGVEKWLAVEWTLRHEMLFYVIFGLVIWRPRIGFIVSALWVLLSPISLIWPLSFPVDFIFRFNHVLFAFGCVGAYLYLRRPVTRPIALLCIGLIGFAATWVVSLIYQVPEAYGVLFYGGSAALAISGATELERRNPIQFPKTFLFLGNASYSIYLVHYAVISVLVSKACRFKIASAHPIITFVIIALIALSCGIAFYILVEKPVMKITRALTANRKQHLETPQA